MSEKIHNKLVRDGIPDVIRRDGQTPEYHRVDGEAYRDALLAKLIEEARELGENPSLEERADVEEVLRALDELFGFTGDAVESVRRDKFDERGGFTKGIFLERVTWDD